MASCWNSAEDELRDLVLQEHPSPSEVLITELFAGKLRIAVNQASSTGKVERAFLVDLRRSIPHLPSDITRRTSGLTARVVFHKQRHEGRVSAADLGVLVTRPIVERASGGDRIKFHRSHATGLLAQAKLGRPAKRTKGGHVWNHLTKDQVRLYPERHGYYSFLLYRLNGLKANELEAFRWQLCRGEPDILQVKEWLRSDVFPEEMTSSQILSKLFARTIRSPHSNVIETIVDPVASDVHSIDLQIFWPDGAGPPPSIELHQRKKESQHLEIRA